MLRANRKGLLAMVAVSCKTRGSDAAQSNVCQSTVNRSWIAKTFHWIVAGVFARPQTGARDAHSVLPNRKKLRELTRSPKRTASLVGLVVAIGVLDAAIAQTKPAGPVSSDQVRRGEYLARAADCISCHTANGGAPYAGGLRLDTPFGYMLTPNITPDPDTGIGGWSANDFYRALHDGVNKRGADMYPTMPYDFYTRVTRADIDAIFAYLRTVKTVRNAVDVNHLYFPFDIRMSMIGWRELYFTKGTYTPDPAKTASWNRGAYLVEGLGHCSACHSPRNLLGGFEKDKDFTGAGVDGWFALNLTSDVTTGLGAWTVNDIATYLKTGAGKTTPLGPMAEVVRNSLRYLTDTDLKAMAEYLKSIPADSSVLTDRNGPDPTRAQGAALYLDHCSGCHQANGRGISGVFPQLAGNGVVLASDPANIFKVVLGGIPALGKYTAMPSFASQLDDQQIADIANYVRTSWGNTAAPDATASMVAKLRKP
jgi:mono/diheme cytochrome c family protein